ncbi:MAG: DUF896 domain-containing protein [Clostridiales Family XIII bacterium]|jgi:uncharacterized protein YnzC (UPF0291/DUF896 family)|nr:DUF896 domain-containing protein [Clostridiales Family XIII bacterium]
MLSQEKMERINELARLSKAEELSEELKAEQDALREEYLTVFRNVFKSQLDGIEIVDEDCDGEMTDACGGCTACRSDV